VDARRARMQHVRLVLALVVAALCYGTLAPVRAGGGQKDFTDDKRGFFLRVPETFKQNPPKPTGSPKYKVASFYDDQAKYKSSGSSNPELNVGWYSTPKVATTPGGGDGATSPEPEIPNDEDIGSSIDDVLDFLLNRNPHLFGKIEGPAASSDRWTQSKAGKTTKQKIDFKYWEFDPDKLKKPDKKDKDSKEKAIWYVFAARLTLERPRETVEVTFQATCAAQFVKSLGPAFLDIVKSFESRDTGGGPVKAEEIPDDPDKYRDYLKRTKLVPGWKYMDSAKKQYLLIYAEGVDDKLVNTVAEQVESLREQVYEVMFPPDKPITAISVIRICGDKTQYMSYGAPGGSAGYWSSWDREIVFYEDMSNKNDSLRVLYHEAFHQYIYYSVGACSPHPWFNEGHGDYFYGFDYKNKKWQLAKSLARVSDATTAKHSGKVPPLKTWLRWEQPEYYEMTQKELKIHANYALGWDFVYFLRTTKKPEDQGILQRYFDTLKGLVTACRVERQKKYPHKETPEEEDLVNREHQAEWHEKAIVEGFKGVDLDQLYKDWMAN
jgi:hypothetical protein